MIKDIISVKSKIIKENVEVCYSFWLRRMEKQNLKSANCKIIILMNNKDLYSLKDTVDKVTR